MTPPAAAAARLPAALLAALLAPGLAGCDLLAARGDSELNFRWENPEGGSFDYLFQKDGGVECYRDGDLATFTVLAALADDDAVQATLDHGEGVLYFQPDDVDLDPDHDGVMEVYSPPCQLVDGDQLSGSLDCRSEGEGAGWIVTGWWECSGWQSGTSPGGDDPFQLQ